jgi:hypothetical protein
MTALCRSYASHAEARAAVDALLEAGVPGAAVRVLSGEGEHDARAEPVGGFAGAPAAGAPVGSFAGAAGGGHGTFAGEEERGGSFADADRDVVTDYPHGVERMRVAGHHRLGRLLAGAGLDRETVARDVEALHAGRVLVLVDVAGPVAERVSAALDR